MASNIQIPTVAGLLEALNHDYTIWIAAAVGVLLGLYYVGFGVSLPKY